MDSSWSPPNPPGLPGVHLEYVEQGKVLLHLLMEAHVQGEKLKLCSGGLSILYHTAFEASKELWHAQKHIHVSLDHQLIVTVLHLVMGKGLKANRGIWVRVNREEG